MAEFWHILSDPAHMAAEIVSHILISAAAYPFIRIAVRVHDLRKHGGTGT